MRKISIFGVFLGMYILVSLMLLSQNSYANSIRVISMSMGFSKYYKKCTRHDGVNCVRVKEIKKDRSKRWNKDHKARKAAVKGMTDFLILNKGNAEASTFALQEVDIVVRQ